jgi:adenylosuccinate lyase
MIDRYALPEMRDLWSLQNKYDTWLKVELAVVDAQAQVGRIPRAEADLILNNARFSLERALEIEAVTRHDLIGFVEAVLENLGPEGRYFHYGVTSYDIEDPALSLQMLQALDMILGKLDRLIDATRERAREHKWTVMMGRTHAIHAEPITLGFKLAVWLAEFLRGRERVVRARENIAWGKVSGAVGTHANIPPQVEAIVCENLGLRPAPASTQILQRDRHAEVLLTLALLSASVEKYATEIRNLQRTEIRELEEAFAKGQKGSSAMPHKRNPAMCEQLSGLARVVRGNVIPALENVTTWHERDLANSSVERIIIPDTTTLVHYQLEKFGTIVANMTVYPENMAANLEQMHGLVFSQQVMLALVGKGIHRKTAYELSQKLAMEGWEGADYRKAVRGSVEVREYLSEAEIERCFDVRYHLQHLEHTFALLDI